MECPSCHSPVDPSQRFCPICGTALTPARDDARVDPIAPANPDPLIGQVLGGKYKIVRLLGEGGMGAVYEGEQTLGTTKRRVAIKTLHPHLSRDPTIQARFEREVGTIAELEHPNTIQVYDFGTTPDGLLYIVMEFLQGKSLADLIASQGALSPERVKHILEQVCESLDEAHKHGIVHRDLKPDNIVLIERAGHKDFVKVLDFGIAKRAREEDKNEQKLTQQGMVLGTPPYMSPEQFSGMPIDSRSDIYSLAIVAYEMLTGQLPFRANTAWEWATQHMTQRPIPIESLAEGGRVPLAMRRAIERALAKSPDQRFATVQEFFQAFSDKSGENARPDDASPAQPRQRTEVGAPLDVAAAFGSALQSGGQLGQALPSSLGGSFANGPPPAVAYTPAGPGGHAIAGAVPPGPTRAKGPGSRTALVAAAGVVGLLSVGAIVFAMRGHSGGGGEVVFDTSAPQNTSSAAPPPTGMADANNGTTESTGTDIPPLSGGGGGQPAPGHAHGGAAPGGGSAGSGRSGGLPPGHPPSSGGSGHEPGINPASGGSTPAGGLVPPGGVLPGGGLVVPPGGVTPGGGQPVPHPTAPAYNGPECDKARTLRALGHPKEAAAFAAACLSRGGAL